MNEEQERSLRALFAESQEPLDGGEFTARVMKQVTRRRQRVVIGTGLAIVLLVLMSRFLLPLPAVALVFSSLPGTALIDLGDGLAAFLLAPVNNPAALLLAVAALLRPARRWLTRFPQVGQRTL